MIDKDQPACSKESQIVLDAMRKAQDAAIRLHRAYNVPMISWQDGKVVELSPFDLQTEEEKLQSSSSAD
ncbi:MAG: hypothetical protein HUJ26_03265 [Planctomycetaceae bacterium]|nr:hypothetical protein [Planctomycetaceae bacterium]